MPTVDHRAFIESDCDGPALCRELLELLAVLTDYAQLLRATGRTTEAAGLEARAGAVAGAAAQPR